MVPALTTNLGTQPSDHRRVPVWKGKLLAVECSDSPKPILQGSADPGAEMQPLQGNQLASWVAKSPLHSESRAWVMINAH